MFVARYRELLGHRPPKKSTLSFRGNKSAHIMCGNFGLFKKKARKKDTICLEKCVFHVTRKINVKKPHIKQVVSCTKMWAGSWLL